MRQDWREKIYREKGKSKDAGLGCAIAVGAFDSSSMVNGDL